VLEIGHAERVGQRGEALLALSGSGSGSGSSAHQLVIGGT
jgi:hypothetical protein